MTILFVSDDERNVAVTGTVGIDRSKVTVTPPEDFTDKDEEE